jgi:hypothetical protein
VGAHDAPTAPPDGAETASDAGYATHYGGGPAWGDAIDYNGLPLGCGGIYRSEDPTIAAVGPARYAQWPCGTQLEICGPVGCAVVERQDSCPGCGPNVIDLSESAHQLVCGAGTCEISFKVGGRNDEP